MRSKEKNRLVVGSAFWTAEIPEWLLDEVAHERMAFGLARLVNPDCEPVGDAEVLAYLHTAALRAPLLGEHIQVMGYLLGTVMRRKDEAKKFPDFVEEIMQKGLSPDELHELRGLRRMIYNVRGDIKNPLIDMLKDMKKKAAKESRGAKNEHEGCV